MNKIPNYALYGEETPPIWHESLHFEKISVRSGAYRWEIEPHQHSTLLQILYLQQGEGFMLHDSRRLPVRAPCIIYIPAQSVHGFSWSGAVEGKVITALQPPLASIAGLLCPNLVPLLQNLHLIEAPCWSAAEDPLLPLFDALEGEYYNRGLEHAACSSGLLLALLVNIFRIGAPAARAEGPANNRRSQQLKLFRDLVEKDFRRHRPVSEYADQLGMTLVTLGRLCQERLGMTPLGVINARLLLEAKRELAYSARSIKEISHELGFSDEGYFSRFFRKHTEQTPSEFRSPGR